MSMLITTPDDASRQFLATAIRGAPFDIDPLDKWFVTLFQSPVALPETLVEPSRTYLATPVSVDKWYDELLGRTNLVLVVKAVAFDHRFKQCEIMGFTPSYPFENYIAHMTLVWGLPPLSSSIKSFINSMNMTFNSRSGNLLGFQGEALIDDSGYSPNVSGQEFFRQHRSIKR